MTTLVPPRGAPWYIGLSYGLIVGFLAGWSIAGAAVVAAV